MSDSATNATSTAGAPRPERDFVSMLRSPRSAEVMHVDGDNLVSAGGAERYQVSCTGIPLFAREFLSDAGRFQQSHYDGMVAKYVENLDYPHTQDYMAYLDRQFLAALPVGSLGAVAELCCGRGEAARLLDGRMERCIGVDVSVEMLEIARRDLPGERFFFAQGDATMLPLREQAHGVDPGPPAGGQAPIAHLRPTESALCEVLYPRRSRRTDIAGAVRR